MSNEKERSKLQEELLGLYLRLNGFFVTGFIVHSAVPGRVSTEVDVLAVRFPHNKQPEREVGPDPLLECSDDRTDLLICEVKGRKKQLQFNEALLSEPGTVASLLRWSGLYVESEIEEIAPKLRAALSPRNPPNKEIPCVSAARSTRVRGILCSPERNKRQDGQAWFLTGPAMLAYISRCLCPSVPRTQCATTYDFGLWGRYDSIVRHIKKRGHNDPGTIINLYEGLNLNSEDVSRVTDRDV
jgi:hypothetical protein